MFSGKQNKKKKDASDKGSKLTEKLESLTKPRPINRDQQETERVELRSKCLVMISATPITTAEKIKKTGSISSGVENADISTKQALPFETNDKVQLDEFDTTQLQVNIARLAKEAGIDLDTTQLSNNEEYDSLDSVLDQISKNIKEVYAQKISNESEKTAAMDKDLKHLQDNNAWIEDTCTEITQKLQELENEVKSKKTLQVDRAEILENLKSIISNTLKSNDDTWIPKFDELCEIIKNDSQRLLGDIHRVCVVFTDTSWEKDLRKKIEKCFDTGDEAAFQRMKVDYTTLFKQLFPNRSSCPDEFSAACWHLAKSYVFPPVLPKHITSENLNMASVPEDDTLKRAPPSDTNMHYTLKSKVLPPVHFNNKEQGDMFLSILGQAKIYFQKDAQYLYKSYDEHRTIKSHDTCPCIFCIKVSQHKHTAAAAAAQCSFCNVHQNHNKQNKQNHGYCACGSCIHFSNYLQGLRFLTQDFADSAEHTPSRAGSFQEQQPRVKEKLSLNKLIGGLLFDSISGSNSGGGNKKK